jgi:DNA-binding ferritin-like protein
MAFCPTLTPGTDRPYYEQQHELVDAIAERIQLLGDVSIVMAHDVAETTLIPRPPKGREEAPVQISRLLPSGARTAIICGIMSTMVLSSDSDFLIAASALVSAA